MDFGVVAFGAASGAEWREKALRCEAAGFEYLFLPDHVGVFDPFSAAAAAANAVRLWVGTLVLNVEFWNPLLLARAAVTTDGNVVQVAALFDLVARRSQVVSPHHQELGPVGVPAPFELSACCTTNAKRS